MTFSVLLETHKLEAAFETEIEAQRWLTRHLARGYVPSTPYLAGIVAHHAGNARTTWHVYVEKQTYNGVVTPAYREGDCVLVDLYGVHGWTPVQGTVTKTYGHGLEVEINKPEKHHPGRVECRDYEVSPLVADIDETRTASG